MRRRDFISLASGVAATWPLGVRGQQPAMPVIGFLHSESPDTYAAMLVAFRAGLREAGYDDGQNVAIEYHWADGQTHRLPSMASDLVRRKVSAIVANTSAALAAKAATATIPILFSTATDPVAIKLVDSLNRPGGNVTGVSNLNVQLGPKRLQVLHELLPAARTIALLVNPTNPIVAEAETRSVRDAADTLGLKIVVMNASSEHDFEPVFAKIAAEHIDALVISSDALFSSRQEIVTLAARQSVPTIYPNRDVSILGGLISYASSVADTYRQLGLLTGRILKGEKPADLPVQQSTRVELVLNMKTAKALGLTFPLALLGRADEVIE